LRRGPENSLPKSQPTPRHRRFLGFAGMSQLLTDQDDEPASDDEVLMGDEEELQLPFRAADSDPDPERTDTESDNAGNVEHGAGPSRSGESHPMQIQADSKSAESSAPASQVELPQRAAVASQGTTKLHALLVVCLALFSIDTLAQASSAFVLNLRLL